MNDRFWFALEAEAIRDTLRENIRWCEHCCAVSDAAQCDDSKDEFWTALGAHPERFQALVGSANSAERNGNAVWFEQGDRLRFLAAPGPLDGRTLRSSGLWICWEGPTQVAPAELANFITRCRSRLQTADAKSISSVSAYSRPIPSAREVLGLRSARDFFELELDDQDKALWSALIGEGAVDVELALRLCAERLRAQGFLDCQLLCQDGRIHQALEERLLAARRKTELFDRPRNGLVRAIQPQIEELTAEQWRDCVVSALEPGARVDREQALRSGFAYAQNVYGVNAHRLRSGGRADQALRSAVNSCVRQGYLARDGAAYLLRIAPGVAPSIRGLPEQQSAASPGTEVGPVPSDGQSPAELSAVEPAATESAPADSAALTITDSAQLFSSPGEEVDSASTPAPRSPLDGAIYTLELPTRALNWAERRHITTVRDLVAWDPEDFAKERNVGRRTVRETRELLEALLGCTWEAARAALRSGQTTVGDRFGVCDPEEVDSTTEALTAGGPTGWAQLAASLTAEQRVVPLLDIRLPTRMKNFAQSERLESVGELFAFPYHSLTARDNLGRKSLNDTLDAVRDFFSEASAPRYATFVESWHAQLAALEPIPRIILTRRAGMHGSRETLEELGAMLGVTRERVRQIEMHVIRRLRERSRWRRDMEARLAAAFGAARAVPLSLLAEDPFWIGIDQQELVLDFVVDRVFEGEIFVVEAPSGRRYLTKFDGSELDERLNAAKARIAKLEFPVESAVIDEILRSEAAPLDPVLFGEFEQFFDEQLHHDPSRPKLVTGFGRHYHNEVIAFLNREDSPVPIGILLKHCGRGRLPDDVLYFKRGIVGLKRHFPDFERWMDRLVPAALDVMKDRPAGRQWLVPEIHDVLCERNLVPEWLGHWHLASLLRLSEKVDYLGRLRVAAKDSGQERRLEYEDLLEGVLDEAGSPLPFDELLRRARVHTDLAEGGAYSTTLVAPFVRLDETLVGLVDRDIPGGPEAVAAAIDGVVQQLTGTHQGMTPHQATELVRALSECHSLWSQQLVASLLRSEPRIRIDRSRNIGLDAWDDVRCPGRHEFIRREVLAAGGALDLEVMYRRLEAVFGRAPDRSALGLLVREAGLTIEGNRIARPTSLAPEAPPSQTVAKLEGIPAELREMFEELANEPLSAVADLRDQVAEHLAALEQEHQVNEFVDLAGGRALARDCDRLLDRWETLPLPERHLAHAAVRYFISWEDLEHDLDIGGLDDDKRIMNSVLAHLGLVEENNAVHPA
jgi:hypothetical protein